MLSEKDIDHLSGLIAELGAIFVAMVANYESLSPEEKKEFILLFSQEVSKFKKEHPDIHINIDMKW